MSDLIELLRQVDEVTLLELLDVSSEELLDAFLDKVADNKDKLYKYVNEQSDASRDTDE